MQARGPVTIDSPLPADTLLFVGMSGDEDLGRPFEYIIDLASEDANIPLADLLGLPLVVHLELSEGEQRHFHGIVTEIVFTESVGSMAIYRARLNPWLSLLQQTTNCRIFQKVNVPSILKSIFREHGFTDFEESLHDEYSAIEYVVQYRETDFDFISRLMESSGIYYYFRHTESAHTLVMADSRMGHSPSPGAERLPYSTSDQHRDRLLEYVDAWKAAKRLTVGQVTLQSFDFERPGANLSARSSAPKGHARSQYERFDYSGAYSTRTDGDKHARVALEQHHTRHEQVTGHTNARAFSVGALFELIEHPRDDQNREYLVTSTAFAITGHHDESSSFGTTDEVTFSCDFSAIDGKTPFRSAPTVARPIIEGPQTALVVGKSGEEIWTDVYGRVKVQFHWDRVGERDENSSCWVRVAQTSAGSNWGSISIPRIGQEVIVDFLDGDPDRPIITGRVYNGSNMPPYGLPANQTQSGFKSRSTSRGTVSNANELRFEDRRGAEEVWLQAERDLRLNVKSDETRAVGGSRATTIVLTDHLAVGGDQTLEIGGDAHRAVARSQTDKINGDHSVTTGGTYTSVVHRDQSVTVSGRLTETVHGDSAETVDGASSRTVMSQHLERVVGGRASVVGSDALPSDDDTYVSGSYRLDCHEEIVLHAKSKIILRCGDSSIEIGPSEIKAFAESIAIASARSTNLSGPKSRVNLTADVEILSNGKISASSTGASLQLDKEAQLSGKKVKLNPGVIAPGSESSTSKSTKKRSISLKLTDEEFQPYKSKTFHVLAEGGLHKGTTEPDGTAKFEISDDTKSAHLLLWEEYPAGVSHAFDLRFEELPPADSVEGIRSRLYQLGYHVARTGAVFDDSVSRAVFEFQQDHARDDALTPTGKVDEKTRAALVKHAKA